MPRPQGGTIHNPRTHIPKGMVYCEARFVLMAMALHTVQSAPAHAHAPARNLYLDYSLSIIRLLTVPVTIHSHQMRQTSVFLTSHVLVKPPLSRLPTNGHLLLPGSYQDDLVLLNKHSEPADWVAQCTGPKTKIVSTLNANTLGTSKKCSD